MTNAQRFIRAYNKLDAMLRSLYDADARIGFSELVRRCAAKNAVISVNEYKLIDYARLRNAIVHQGVRDEVIAQPHTDVVEELERIAELVASPPAAIEVLPQRPVQTVGGGVKLKEAICSIHRSGYSNLPVIRGGKLIGVLNNRLIVHTLAAAASRGESIDNFCEQTNVSDILDESRHKQYYSILPKAASVTDVLNEFNQKRKLLCVVITQSGHRYEKPLGIITTADIIDLARAIDDYNMD